MYNYLNFNIMKTRVLLVAMAFATGLFFTSCEKEEVAKPVISSIEYGSSHDNPDSHTAYQGGDMHIDAEIVAEGKIDYITVELHPEGEEQEEGHEHEGWEYDSTYTEGFNGLKNATFHKHIKISSETTPGEYHFHFIVVDMKGNQVTYEGDVEILEEESNIAVSNLSVNGGVHDVSKASGSFTISFDASVETGTLASYSIEVHSEPESGNEADEFKLMDDEFTDSFNGLTNASVNKTVSIDAAAPLGEYHVEIVIIDSEANEKIVSAHIDLEN
jgi:hypothetical protein